MDFAHSARVLTDNIERVIDGKPDAVRTAVVVFLSEGHLLIEDAPGVGKTVLAKALGRSVGSSVRRIQFTPDLLPSDITGVSVFDPASREFEFKPGSVFANIVIGDEINRASPKTQSAMLEAMEERQVTVDGTTYQLGSPFTVVATQNPYEMEGTYALPEAQRDRFMARLRIGYPDAAAEIAMLRDRDEINPLDELPQVLSIDEVRQMIAHARSIHVSEAVEEYVVSICQATRTHAELRLGASPRAALQLVRAAKTLAAIEGHEFVLPDHIDHLAGVVLPHRLVANGRGIDVADVVTSIVDKIAVPSGSAHVGQPR